MDLSLDSITSSSIEKDEKAVAAEKVAAEKDDTSSLESAAFAAAMEAAAHSAAADAARAAAKAMYEADPSASVFSGTKRSVDEVYMPPAVGIEPPVDVGIDIPPTYVEREVVVPEAPLQTLANVAGSVFEPLPLKKKHKSNKCVFTGLVFGSMPVNSIQKSASMRLLQVLSGSVLPEMRSMFDSDKIMIDGFHLDLYLSMANEMKKHLLDTDQSICIPQKCVRSLFLNDAASGGVKYSKIVQYITQDTNKSSFDGHQISTLLNHFSKQIKNIYKQFPMFGVKKIGSMVLLEFKKA